MRVIPLQLVLFVSLGFGAAAYAAHPAVHPVQTKSAHGGGRAKTVAPVHGSRAKLAAGHETPRKPENTRKSGHKSTLVTSTSRRSTAKNAKIDSLKLASRRVEAPRPTSSRRHAVEPAGRVPDERVPDERVPEAAVPQTPITVHHDRKQHFSGGAAESSVGTSGAESGTEESETYDVPRKATSEDFLVPFAAAGDTRKKELVAGVSAGTEDGVRVSKLTTEKLTVPHKLAVAPVVLPEASVVGKKPAEKQVIAKAVAIPVAAPIVVAMRFDRRGRVILPPALKGSHEILVHQNEMADLDGLDRVQDDAAMARMREAKQLVALPDVNGLQADERLPEGRRYCRPWTAKFLADLARAHYAKFHTALQVNSAVRTVEVQERLLRTNGNAAPVEGQTASPHLTGQAVDLAKHGLSLTEIAWLRGYLMPLVQAGKVDVEEEFQQACFHISVYRKYVPGVSPKREIAAKGRGAALAVVLP
jgi:hypothetical protein